MLSSSVLAVVLVRNQPQLLQECLDAVSNQAEKPNQVVVLDLRDDAHTSPLQEPASLGLEITTVVGGGLPEFEAVQQLLAGPMGSHNSFVWLLSEDSVPATQALARMLGAFEVSPSLAQVAPKLLHRDQARRIMSLGLTSSRFGAVLRRRSDEYDQGQFDGDSDVLAATLMGSLLRINELAGADPGPVALASDTAAVRVGLQLRAGGQRIAVVPAAWVSQNPSSASPFESFRLDFATRLALTPTWLGWASILLLPLESIFRSLKNLFLKQTRAVIPSLAFGIWFWCTLPLRLKELKRFFATATELRQSLKPLLASQSEVKLRRSVERSSQVEPSPVSGQPGFIESGVFWFTLLPLVFSIPLLPIGVFAQGLGLAPLSPTLGELFDSYQLSPESAWLLPLISMLWVFPGETALGFAWLLFLLPSIAFISSWQFFRSLAGNRGIALVSALAYSLSPMIFNARVEGEPLVAITAACLPWVLLALIRATQSVATSRRWRWLAVAGLLLAISSAASPIALPITILFAIGMFVNRKLGLHWLLVALLPAGLILFPRILKYIADPVTLFTGWDSTGPTQGGGWWSSLSEDWLTSGVLTTLALLLLSTVAIVMQPSVRGAALLSLALAALFSQLLIAEIAASATVIALLLLLASLLVSLAEASSVHLPTIANFSLLTILILALPSLLQPVEAEWRQDSRVSPAIVHAAAAINPGVLTLVIETSDQLIRSSLQIGNGTHLDQQQDGSDIFLRNQLLPIDEVQQAQLAAALVAGATDETRGLLSEAKISFVLLKTEDIEVRTNLDSSGLLESAGVTEWGRLWRVEDSNENLPTKVPTSIWAIANFGIVAVYLLLAAPTPGSLRRNRSDASIFVEGDDQL